MKIFSSKQDLELANQIINLSDVSPNDIVKLGSLVVDRFSDGEILPIFKESVRNQDIFFVSSLNSSDKIMECLLVIDAAKRAGCGSFTLVSPYLGYSRQDKTDHLRSSIGSKMIADILEKVGMSRIITISLHASAIQGFYNVPVIHLNGNKIFIDYIESLNLSDICILAPDQGAVKRASDFCKAFPESTFAMINKKRIKPNEIHSMELVGDVTGKNVIIVDDMADTLGTMKKAAEIIMSMGAKSVRAVATHGILSGKAFENLETSMFEELIVSDSIPQCAHSKLRVVSCSKIIGKSIMALTQKKSIHELNAI
jgi:ribose-phosphate pyrophosphokinase